MLYNEQEAGYERNANVMFCAAGFGSPCTVFFLALPYTHRLPSLPPPPPSPYPFPSRFGCGHLPCLPRQRRLVPRLRTGKRSIRLGKTRER